MNFLFLRQLVGMWMVQGIAWLRLGLKGGVARWGVAPGAENS